MISLCTRQDFRVRREESTHHERSRRPIQRGITVAGLASTLIIRRHDARRVRGVHTTRYHAEPAASVRHSDRYSKDQTTQHRRTVNPRRRDAARDGEEAHRRGDLPDDIVHGA